MVQTPDCLHNSSCSFFLTKWTTICSGWQPAQLKHLISPWLAWLGALSAGLQTQESPVDSWLGHMPGLRATSPVGDMWEATKWHFSPSLSHTFPLSLKINKILKKQKQKQTFDFISLAPLYLVSAMWLPSYQWYVGGSLEGRHHSQNKKAKSSPGEIPSAFCICPDWNTDVMAGDTVTILQSWEWKPHAKDNRTESQKRPESMTTYLTCYISPTLPTYGPVMWEK